MKNKEQDTKKKTERVIRRHHLVIGITLLIVSISLFYFSYKYTLLGDQLNAVWKTISYTGRF